jgi:hypothetical protein
MVTLWRSRVSSGQGSEDQVRYNDRVLIVGKTDSGKSVLARHLFSHFQCRKTVIDPKANMLLEVPAARDPGELDVAAPLSHFIPTELEDWEYEEVFRRLWFAGGPRVIWLDEAAGPTRKGYAPKFLRILIQQGREPQRGPGFGLIACSQRPVAIEATLRTEAEHVFIFVPRPPMLDLRTLAGDIGKEPEELRDLMEQLQETEGLHSHLWYRRRTAELLLCAPLPASWVTAEVRGTHPGRTATHPDLDGAESPAER